MSYSPPRSFSLANRRWKVRVVSARYLTAIAGQDVYGMTDPNKCLVYLVKDLDEHLLEHTFEHELGHAIDHVLGINSSEKDTDARAALRCQYNRSRRGAL